NRETRGRESGSLSDLHSLERHLAIHKPGVVPLDGVQARDLVNVRGRADEIGLLEKLQARLLELEAGGVERASLVLDQHDPLELVHLDKELQLIDHALFLEAGLRVAGEAGRAAGKGDAVVAGELQ